MRRCRYRPCRAEFYPRKANYYFCSWECHQAHYASNNYRGYRQGSNQSYDRGYSDVWRARTATTQTIPPHIWKALAVLVHPDKWQDAPAGIKELSHEAMVWLNTYKPVGAERN
jgi:hypothetical protein